MRSKLPLKGVHDGNNCHAPHSCGPVWWWALGQLSVPGLQLRRRRRACITGPVDTLRTRRRTCRLSCRKHWRRRIPASLWEEQTRAATAVWSPFQHACNGNCVDRLQAPAIESLEVLLTVPIRRAPDRRGHEGPGISLQFRARTPRPVRGSRTHPRPASRRTSGVRAGFGWPSRSPRAVGARTA